MARKQTVKQEDSKLQGFSPDEQQLMLHFLWNYEKKLKGFKNNKSLCEKYNRFNSLVKMMDNLKIQTCTIKKIPSSENQLNGKVNLFLGERNSRLISLMYHLRNAIAHASILKDEQDPIKYVHFTDYSPYQKHVSAFGRIKIGDFDNLFKVSIFDSSSILKPVG